MTDSEGPGTLRGLFDWAGAGARLYLRPLAAAEGSSGERRFEMALRQGSRIGRAQAPLTAILDWATGAGREAEARRRLVLLDAAPTDFAGLALDRPRVMGIVNVTPDSFSDGGRFLATDQAIAHGLALAEAGADIVDVGGESTRPGAPPVERAEEEARVLPVVAALAQSGCLVSIDTRHAAVMARAVAAGARIINDVTALTGDSDSLAVAAASGAAVVLMHMQGEPRTMQVAPAYADVALDIFDYLETRVAACASAGIARARLAVDPGIGFGKTLAHNLALLNQTALFRGLGVPVLTGASRKSFIGRLSGGAPADRRVGGSVAAALAAWERGAALLRVHDVAETMQALAVWRAIRNAASATDLPVASPG